MYMITGNTSNCPLLSLFPWSSTLLTLKMLGCASLMSRWLAVDAHAPILKNLTFKTLLFTI